VEGIAGVFESLRATHIDVTDLLVQEGEQTTHRLPDTFVAGTQNNERRIEEVGDPRSFAEKFRAHRGPDGPAHGNQFSVETRLDDAITGTWWHGAAHHHRMEPGRRWRRDRHGRPDVMDSAAQIRQISVTLRQRGRADAQERNVRACHRGSSVSGRRQETAIQAVTNEVVNPGLHNRATAGTHSLDLHPVHIDADGVPRTRARGVTVPT
jgi:hypothetical protein